MIKVQQFILVAEGRFRVLRLSADADIGIEQAREIVALLRGSGQRGPLLIDARTFFTISPEARNYFARPDPSCAVTAAAVLVNNLPSRLTANFFIAFNRPRLPFRVFSDENEAAEWLEKKKRNSMTCT